MRASARFAAAAAAGAILLWVDTGLTQEAQTALPDVNVVAPVPAPHRFSPMAGKTRVEEDKWPEIPCDKSRIASGAAGKCQDGPRVENFMSVMSTGPQPTVGSACNIAHQLLSVDVGRLAVEADALVFDPYLVTASGFFNKFCTVWGGYSDLPEDFKDMNQVTRRGVDWHGFVPGGTSSAPQSTIAFSDGQRGCIAVERLGPGWRGGYVWVVHATICAAGAPPIGQADIDAVFARLQIRIYDPSGNLRPPG